MLPAVEFAQRTDPGRDPDKQVNEDVSAYEETAFGHLCVLCDGMGGHLNGREAAEVAVEAIRATFAKAQPPAGPPMPPGSQGPRARELLGEAIVAANARVRALGGDAKVTRPGSTVVALLMHSEGVEIAHVGDSRCYLLQAGQAFQITKDHTVVQKMVDAQLLSPAQAAAHPDANQILRALGTSADIEVEVRAQSIPLADGDAFVLCSDGLSDLVEPQEIFGIVMGAPAAKAAGQLVELANARGGHDNVTVMILRRENGATAARESAKGVAQTLFEMPAMAMAPAPGVAPTLAGVPAVTSQPAAAASDPTSSGPHLPVAPPPPPRRSRISAVVVFGVILGIVGFGAVGFAVFLLLNPSRDAKVVAPFALSGAPLVAPPPSVALVPVAPKPLPVFGDGAPPAPLPSLTPPTRTLRHGHGP